jgi:hypothetical protein
MDRDTLAKRHPATQQLARWFAYDHLKPGTLARLTSMNCAGLAEGLLLTIPDGPELTAGLRKLLEAKDCFVRAALAAGEQRDLQELKDAVAAVQVRGPAKAATEESAEPGRAVASEEPDSETIP